METGAPERCTALELAHTGGRLSALSGHGAERRRRCWSREEKLRMVTETYEPGASVSLVARRHDINANLLFIWRRLAREGGLAPGLPAVPAVAQEFIPITVAGDLVADDARKVERSGVIEIYLPTGVRLRVDASVDGQALRRVLKALKDV